MEHTIKDRLEAFKNICGDLNREERRYASFVSRMQSAPSGSGSGIQSSPEDLSPSQLADKGEIEEKIQALKDEKAYERDLLTGLIAELRSQKEKDVLVYFYIDGDDWDSVTEKVFGDRDDYKRSRKMLKQRSKNLCGSGARHLQKNRSTQRAMKGWFGR